MVFDFRLILETHFDSILGTEAQFCFLSGRFLNRNLILGLFSSMLLHGMYCKKQFFTDVFCDFVVDSDRFLEALGPVFLVFVNRKAGLTSYGF